MKIICLGDSFTRGFGVKKKDSWISLFDDENIQLINKGINGDTTSGMLSRFGRDVIDEKPKYVLITGSTNDFICGSSLEIPQNNYMAMVHQAYHHGIFPIAGIAPGPDPSQIRSDWADFSDFNKVFDKHIHFRKWIYGFCKTFNLPLLDFHKEFETIKKIHPEENFYLDGLHLTSSGHCHINSIVKKYFKSLEL